MNTEMKRNILCVGCILFVLAFTRTGALNADNLEHLSNQSYLALQGDFKFDDVLVHINGKKFFKGKVYSKKDTDPVLHVSLEGIIHPNQKFTIEVNIETTGGSYKGVETLKLDKGEDLIIIFGGKEENNVILIAPAL